MGRLWFGCWLVLLAGCGGGTPTSPATIAPPVGTPAPNATDDPVVPAPPQPIPRLKVTKLLAFGDSLTEGRIAVSRTQLVVVPGSYPDRLQRLLAARYGNQTIEVYNEGRAGEWAQDGLTRFASVVRELRPEVVILLEGANDLAAQGQRGISRAEGAIESMVKEARNRGAAVILAGLPPQASNSTSADLVRDYNIRMREVARDEQVTFVDLFAAFGSRADTGLIGPDGLHPTPSGYERMAQTFFDVIRAVFEVSPAALTTTRR